MSTTVFPGDITPVVWHEYKDMCFNTKNIELAKQVRKFIAEIKIRGWKIGSHRIMSRLLPCHSQNLLEKFWGKICVNNYWWCCKGIRSSVISVLLPWARTPKLHLNSHSLLNNNKLYHQVEANMNVHLSECMVNEKCEEIINFQVWKMSNTLTMCTMPVSNVWMIIGTHQAPHEHQNFYCCNINYSLHSA